MLTARIYEHETSATEALLTTQHEETPLRSSHAKRLSSLKKISLMIGLAVGLFIQCSTLGVNYLVITVWGENSEYKSKQDVVVFSFLWSFFTSVLALVILAFLRNLVTISYGVSSRDNSALEEMILHMECRFVIGALVGVCAAWSVTDLFLGLKAQIVYSLITMGICVLWCQFMTSIIPSRRPEVRTTEDIMIV